MYFYLLLWDAELIQKTVSSELGNNAFPFYDWKQSAGATRWTVLFLKRCHRHCKRSRVIPFLSCPSPVFFRRNILLSHQIDWKCHWVLSSMWSPVCRMSQDLFSVPSHAPWTRWLWLCQIFWNVYFQLNMEKFLNREVGPYGLWHSNCAELLHINFASFILIYIAYSETISARRWQVCRLHPRKL